MNPPPRWRVGGTRSPFEIVTSCPVRPPRGPISSYWPDLGALSPDFTDLFIFIPHSVPIATTSRGTRGLAAWQYPVETSLAVTTAVNIGGGVSETSGTF